MVLVPLGFTVALRVAESVVTEVAQPVRTVGSAGGIVVVVVVEVVDVGVVVVEVVDVEVVLDELVVDVVEVVVVVVVVVPPCFVRMAVSGIRQPLPPASLNASRPASHKICVKSELNRPPPKIACERPAPSASIYTL